MFIRINPSFHLDAESLALMDANRLCITPKYLSDVSRSVTGLPASQWIQFYATFELVSLLRSSFARLLPAGRKNDQSKTLTEVADLMHFEAPSHFSRYVKKVLEKTPSEYRNVTKAFNGEKTISIDIEKS